MLTSQIATATVDEVEARALDLSEKERARLVSTLSLSLAELDAEVAEEWLDEATRRNRELDEGSVSPIAASEALDRAFRAIG